MRHRAILKLVFALLLMIPGRVGLSVEPAEPRIFLMGVWPDRLRLFDEKTEEFVGEIRLRHGAAIGRANSPDYRRFYFVTGQMQSIEVVDIPSRTVVDELTLTDGSRKVFINAVAPDDPGKLLYLVVRSVGIEVDRYLAEEPGLIVYDLEANLIKQRFELPEEIATVGGPFSADLRVSPDGKSLFAFTRDIYELDTSTLEIIDKIVLSKPLHPGYGPFRGPSLYEIEPMIYYGIYRTTEPYIEKSMLGVTRLDLRQKEMESFELGPQLNVRTFALSLDGKRGYAGMKDMIVIDMEARRVLNRKEGFEQGRANNSLIVSADGKKLYVGGVGDTIHVYDAENLEPLTEIFAGGDFMSEPIAIPRASLEAGVAQD
jgi:hypothetical protein